MDISIGARIQQRRKLLNITQSTISEITGISTGNLSGIEKGRSLPSASALIALSHALNCSIDWILTGTSSISENSSLIESFNKLSSDDQEEILAIIDLKLKRQAKNIVSLPNNHVINSYISQIPILGYVAAGSPIIAYENPLSFINTYNRLVSYALYAKGNSMEPVIHDGEIIEIEKTDTLENGDIGIIQIDEEVTCKKFYRYSDRIELVSFNSDFEPIQIFKKDLKNVQILGKVVLNDIQNRRL